MNQHTPGQWRAGYEREAYSKHTMIVRAEGVDGAPWVAICRSNFGDIPIKANARLISAAPDLLEALQEMVKATQRFNRGLSYARELADKAILKATGDAP